MKLREIVLLGTLGASLMTGCVSKQVEFKDDFNPYSKGCAIENLNRELNKRYKQNPIVSVEPFNQYGSRGVVVNLDVTELYKRAKEE